MKGREKGERGRKVRERKRKEINSCGSNAVNPSCVLKRDTPEVPVLTRWQTLGKTRRFSPHRAGINHIAGVTPPVSVFSAPPTDVEGRADEDV